MSDILPKGTALPAHYVLEGAVGSGRIRTVYAAHDIENHRAAASILHEDLVEAMGEWFENTAILGRTLEHPNLVRTLALGHVSNDRPVVLTELLEGETLAEILASRTNALAPNEVARIVTQLGAALDYLHERSPVIVHRALTPENVFLADPDARVKLLEVGSHDRPRFAASRAHHRSPEELAGITELSPRADVFSLASLSYELLTGQPAYSGNANSVLDAIRSGQRPRVSDQREEVSGRVDEVLLRAWSLSPEVRQQSAGAFARALSEALSDLSDTTAPRHSQRVLPRSKTPAGEAQSRTRSSSPPDEVNPMEEFPTVKLMIGVGGTVVVRHALAQGSTPGTTPASAPGPAARPTSGTPRPISQPFRTTQRVGAKPIIPPPPSPIGSEVSPTDQDPTSKDIRPKSLASEALTHEIRPRSIASEELTNDIRPRSLATEGLVADDPTPTLDALVAMDPTAVIQTLPEGASDDPLDDHETPSVVIAPSAARLTPMGVPAPSLPLVPAPVSVHPTPLPPSPDLPLSPVPPPAPAPISSPPPSLRSSVPPAPPAPPTSPPTSLRPEGISPAAQPNYERDGDPTESYSIPPAPRIRVDRSPVVMAAAFLANAILIVGIAHALAWGSRSRATPVVIQAPAPVCAPCAACPPPPRAPECPAVLSPPRPSVPVRPTGLAPGAPSVISRPNVPPRPPGPRPVLPVVQGPLRGPGTPLRVLRAPAVTPASPISPSQPLPEAAP